MSQKFNRLLKYYLENWPNVEGKNVYQNGRLRARIINNFLCTYDTEILRITNKAIWVNNHRYSLTSTRDRSAIYSALHYESSYMNKPVIYIDFEMLKRLMTDCYIDKFLDEVLVCDIEQDESIVNDYTYINGYYYTFKFQSVVYYAYMLTWPSRKTERLQFICQLPGNWVEVVTIKQAREILKPSLIRAKNGWIEGKDYYRQGDLFFITYWFEPKIQRAFYKYGQGNEISLMANRIKKLNLGRHVLSEACLKVELFGLIRDEVSDFRNCQMTVFARGYVRHPEHGKLKLGNGKTWFLVQKNTAVRSIGFEGKHD
jgi:hypothetical protein